MAKMEISPYYIHLKKVESTSEFQFKEKEALEKNDSGTDELDSSSDEEAPTMADEIDDRAVFLVGGTSKFEKAIKLSIKVLS